MKVLIIGKGGREDALCWKIGQSPLCSQIYCLPGNDGISEREKVRCLSLDYSKDPSLLIDFVKKEKIDLTVVGPEAPLVNGISDLFERENLKIFGPKKEGARLEGSKVFAKNFMRKYGIPTPDFKVFDNPQKAESFALSSLPCVIKADGLAGGKGSFVCFEKLQVKEAIDRIMIKKEFKESGKKIVIEEFLEGQECSFLILTDGKNFLSLLPAKDHKRLLDNDEGPNTGGMGVVAPAPFITKEIEAKILKEIVLPTLEGLRKEKIEYKGCLYFGLILTKEGPRILEYNCRFGDPETQPLVTLIKNDFLKILKEVAEGNLEGKIVWDKKYAICVVLASGGYPGKYEKGEEIKGIKEAEKMEDVVLFKAGVKKEGDIFKTAGGRVLGVTAKGETLREAFNLAYTAVKKISFRKMHYRKDIGKEFLD